MVVAAVLIPVTLLLARAGVRSRAVSAGEVTVRLMRETLPLAVAFAMSVIYFRVLVVLVSLLSTDVETGLFGTSFRIFEMLLALPALILSVALPLAVGRRRRGRRPAAPGAAEHDGGFALDRRAARRRNRDSRRARESVSSAGRSTSRRRLCLRIQALALIPLFLVQIWQLGLIAGRAQRAMAVANGLALVIVIALGLLFVPGGGATAAAWVAVAAEGALAVFLWIALGRARPGGAPSLWFAWKVALAAAVSAGAGYLLRDSPLLAACAATVLFAVVAVATRAVPADLYHALGLTGRRGKAMSNRPRVVVLRGHHANIGELRPWELLLDRFEVEIVTTARADQDIEGLRVPWITAATRRERLPRGRLGTLATHAIGDAYADIESLVQGAAIVHTAELGPWFAAQPARLRRRHRFRLVVTVWETIPFRAVFRTSRAAANRRLMLAETDLFLPTTERARRCLLLEGAQPDRIQVVEPGIDVDRFAGGVAPDSQQSHMIVSAGRLVWEKGHYDVIRALKSVTGEAHLLIVGAGPERDRLLRYADDLDLRDRVEVRAVQYDEMPAVFGRASCVVLASLPIRTWEEQFGLVLAEALAAGAPIIASSSGAIPEVLEGSGAPLFSPGDWIELADLLEAGPLSRPPGTRIDYPAEVVERYSTQAAAARLTVAYERVLATLPVTS